MTIIVILSVCYVVDCMVNNKKVRQSGFFNFINKYTLLLANSKFIV